MGESSRVHLKYLDGLRGWASLFVVFHHIWQFVAGQVDRGPLPRWFTVMTVFKYGPLAVTVFIVLSGYSLMIPVVRTGGATFSDGLVGFVRRRARRILPAYYATLVFSVLLLAVYPALRHPGDTQWDLALPALSVENLSLHAVLLHNLFESWQWKLNPPLWSVALEWQIYFVFALVLLPLWRRFGPHAALATAFIVGLAPLPFGGAYTHSWYLASFALGMCAAAANFGAWRVRYSWISSVPWGLICGGCLIVVAVWLVVLKGNLNDVDRWGSLVLAHFGVSLAAIAFLIRSTDQLAAGHRSALVRGMSHPWSTTLGECSYSLYLIHYPIVAALCLPLRGWHVSQVMMFAILTLGGTPVILASGYAFHLAFEKPFMRSRSSDREVVMGVSPSRPS